MPPSPHSNARGIALMCVSMALFTASDAFVKLAAELLPVAQVLALRGLIVVIGMAVAVSAMGQWRSAPLLMRPRVLIRSLLEGLVAFAFVNALTQMGLADATAVFLTTPLMLTVLSAVYGGEQVGWRRWLAVIVGFVGMLIVVRPSPEGVNIYGLVVIGAALGSSVRDFITRKLDPALPSSLVAFMGGVAAAVMGFAFGLTVEWRTPSPAAWAYLCASALVVSGGTVLVIAAFRSSELSVISPFRYTIMLWALIAGMLVWGELPDTPALIGTGIIVASGLYIIHRERVRSRELRTATLTTASPPRRV